MPSDVAKRVVLPGFTLTELCDRNDQDAIARKIPMARAHEHLLYSYRPVCRESTVRGMYSYNLFPVVVIRTGALWTEANLYLLSCIRRVTSPRMTTYWGIADDLAAFRRFLEDEHIDFDVFPKQRLLRPTYRFRAFLQQGILANEISPTTARRRMGSVIGFYRWLSSEGLLPSENAPWIDRDTYIQITDSQGFAVTKQIKTTDLAIKVPQQRDPYAETIDDGGKLRPLSYDEQEQLIDTLIAIGNTEMTLIHLVALFTGARIQTVLTLRVRHFRQHLSNDVSEVRLPIGPGTMVDTKYDKQMVLFIPPWLYNQLNVYSFSDRAAKRRNTAGDDSDNQYLFLSNRGVPFYMSKEDCAVFNSSNERRHQKIGQTVRQFIIDRVIPLMGKKTKPYQYRFHDLRASYGMNLTDQQLKLVEEGKTTLHSARDFVKTRMGHESAATTDLYMNHRQSLQFAAQVQSAYEEHIRTLADKAKGLIN